jgi:arabinofuranan 3-O-arabinosyltransferase
MTRSAEAGVNQLPSTTEIPPKMHGPTSGIAVERLRLAAVSLALALMTFAANSGQTAADTKIDLVVDPTRFLRRALTLWDPIGNAGQLQNQAYGYLFPVGPFFAVCRWLGFAPWSAQRLWQTVLVLAAFLGLVQLSKLLGVRGLWPRVGAGLVYALAPQILTELSSISAALTPTAALPWVLIPLVRGAHGGSPRRAAAWSGVALLFAGGTNAAATLAILPAPALWLLTRERGDRRASLIRNWLAAATLACMWWLIPLLVLGRYSPPFLDWIEAAQNTTATTSLSAAIRGVEHWEAYLGASIWPAGWILVSAPAAILATSAVAATGLAGLAERATPNRVFLLSCLFLGVALVTFGHAASISGPYAGELRSLLDGALVAFRNIHKFDPLIRLPIALGVGFVLSKANAHTWRQVRLGSLSVEVPVRALSMVAAAAIAAVAIAPVFANQLVSEPRSNALPTWWRETGQWLAAHDDGSRALVVPGAARPTYFWGETVDDALQPVATTPWIVRSAVPLAQAGTIRLLDTLESRLATGHSDDALAELMARSGVGYVVVRNDLNTTDSIATPYNLIRSTLLSSPGFERVAGFGPVLGGGVSRTQLVDGGVGVSRSAVEIFKVAGASGPVDLLPSDHSVISNGSTDELAQLVDRGLPGSTPVLFNGDGRTLNASNTFVVGTDGIRRQQAGFGNNFAKSRTLTATEAFAGKRRAYDYLPDRPPSLSTMRYAGIADVTASSSGADVYAAVNRSPANGPWSALDNDSDTAWRSGSARGAVGQWIEVRLNEPVLASSIGVAFVDGLGIYPTQLTVRTDGGDRTDTVKPSGSLQTLALPSGPTRSIRLTVRATTQGFGSSIGIADLSIPGVIAQRTLVVPDVGAPQLVAFDAAPGFRDGCLLAHALPTCDIDMASSGEEDSRIDRRFALTSARTYRATAVVWLRGSTALENQLDSLLPVRAEASSVMSTDPRVRPSAAVDGDAATAWVAAPGDERPTLTLSWKQARLVRGLRIVSDPNSPISAPTRVRVEAGNEVWAGELPSTGVIMLSRQVSARTVKVTVLEASLRTSVSTLTGKTRLLPVGVNSVVIETSVRNVAITIPQTIRLGCSDGLSLTIDGRSLPLKISARTADVLAGKPVVAVACDDAPIGLEPGEHHIVLAGSLTTAPRSLTLAAAGTSIASLAPTPGKLSVSSWQATDRAVQVDTSAPSLLVVHENFNSGWHASVGGHALSAIRVDGWQQAFQIPAGTNATVHLDYRPQRTFSASLILGLLFAIGLIAMAIWPAGNARTAPSAELAPRWLTQLTLAAIIAVQVAGVAGVLTFLLIAAVRYLLWPADRSVPSALPAIAFLAAGVGIASATAINRYAVANTDTTQLLAVAALCLAALGGLPRRRRPAP